MGIDFNLTWLTCVAAIVCTIIGVINYRRKLRNPLGLPLPPGPKPLPIIGNILEMHKDEEWLKYHKWANEYGEIMHVSVLNKNVIFLNSMQAVRDLLDNRSALYSDRPRLRMLEFVSWDWNFGVMRYGDEWRTHRRLFHQFFHQNATKNYWPTITRTTRVLLKNFLLTPHDFTHHIQRSLAMSILSIAYGYEVPQQGPDEFITLAAKAMWAFTKAGNPGMFYIDFFPFLKYFPAWFPGGGFKNVTKGWDQSVRDFRDKPFDLVKRRMAEGTASACLTSSLLEDLKAHEAQGSEKEKIIKNCMGVAYAGGTDTMVSAISTFLLAMVLYPDVQKKAQIEIDAVIGHDRLPEFSDRPSLPYIESVLREVLRWHPVTPEGTAHAVTEDDYYNGYYVPRGSIILPNTWAILHDEAVYPNAYTFVPERFLNAKGQLDDNVMHPSQAAFGFGRRICSGRHFADATVWLTIASVLASFTISKALDEHGIEIEVTGHYGNGMISHPDPFQCFIKPRSANAGALVRDSM